MTHPIYSQTNLDALPTAQLKAIARSIGAVPDGDKRSKQVWVNAIINHQTAFSPVKVAAMEQHIETVMNRLESIPSDADETPTTDNYVPTSDTSCLKQGLSQADETPTTDNYVPADDEAFCQAMGLSYDDVFGNPLGNSEWEETAPSLEPNPLPNRVKAVPAAVLEPKPAPAREASIVALVVVLAFGMAILIIKTGFASFVWIIAALLPLALGLWQCLFPDTKQQVSIDYFPQV